MGIENLLDVFKILVLTLIKCCMLLLIMCFIGSCGSSSSSSSSSSNPKLIPANGDANYSAELAQCAFPTDNYCWMSELPLLGQQFSSPTYDDILGRTLVSHQWMATRFAELLPVLPADILILLKSVTGVVIASDIRPSYYHPYTGFIYLDAQYLWLSETEKATIDQAEDFRSDYGASLGFVPLWRYVKGNDYAWSRISLDQPGTRSLSDIAQPMARLLYHELAHANDYFPSNDLSSLSLDQSLYEVLTGRDEQSQMLTTSSPLNSTLWSNLAMVLYRGEDSNVELNSYSALEVGLEFEADGASSDYAYSTPAEDFAMLFEEVMMKYHFDVDREIAFTDKPPVDSRYCDDYVVRWGVRNRVASPWVLARAETVLQLVWNQSDVSAFTEKFTAVSELPLGVDWCEALRSFAPNEGQASQGRAAAASILGSGERPLLRMPDRLPVH